MTFQEKLDKIVKKNKSFVCVGLDSDLTRLPPIFNRDSARQARFPQFEFNKAIIDATHDLVCAYKPNGAFYEAEGTWGIEQLKMTCDYLRSKYPKIPIILDAKRADIGSTNKGYVKYAFDYLGVDAITVHPYLGKEALMPFLEKKDKGIIILCKTSNPGSGEFQNLNSLYLQVARQIVKEWNINKNCMLVVGATYPEELMKVRKIIGDMTILIPGIGAQGGDLEKTIKAGLNSKKSGIIINSSRGIIFASEKKDFAQRAREEAKTLRNQINKIICSSNKTP